MENLTTPPESAPTTREPIFNIREKAPIVLGILLLIIHVLVFYGGRFGMGGVERFAEVWALLKSANYGGQTTLSKATALIGHGFIHGSWTHVLLNVGMMIPFGVVTIRGAKLKAASKGKRSSGNLAFLFIFLAGVIIGGAGQFGLWTFTNESGLALGASGGVSALFASMAWAMGGPKQLLKFGFGWLVINILMIFGGGLLTGGGGVAWAAHLAGFVAGAVLAPLLVRPNINAGAITAR
jgi:membrane associated rhomboid family serine protease